MPIENIPEQDSQRLRWQLEHNVSKWNGGVEQAAALADVHPQELRGLIEGETVVQDVRFAEIFSETSPEGLDDMYFVHNSLTAQTGRRLSKAVRRLRVMAAFGELDENGVEVILRQTGVEVRPQVAMSFDRLVELARQPTKVLDREFVTAHRVTVFVEDMGRLGYDVRLDAFDELGEAMLRLVDRRVDTNFDKAVITMPWDS